LRLDRKFLTQRRRGKRKEQRAKSKEGRGKRKEERGGFKSLLCNVLAALSAYSFLPHKPSIRVPGDERALPITV
jgi:hypothetical protein